MAIHDKSVQIGDEIFYYDIVNNAFATITGYRNVNGELTFPAPKYICPIHVPKEIEGFPVMSFRKRLSVDLKENGPDSYAHNGRRFLEIHLPEGTFFPGFDRVSGDMGGWCYPAYKAVYYPRTTDYLCREYRGAIFYARETGVNECEIIWISTDHQYKDENIWDTYRQTKSIQTLIFPSEIEGVRVTAIGDNATDGIPRDLNAVIISDTVRSVGSDCFKNLNRLRTAHLANVEVLGENCFSFHETCRYSADDIPSLTVYHFKELSYPSSAFKRDTEVERYEDYSDWGPMYVGSDMVNHDVSFTIPDDDFTITDDLIPMDC